MYFIFTYIWVIYGVNVGKYTIHGWSGILNICFQELIDIIDIFSKFLTVLILFLGVAVATHTIHATARDFAMDPLPSFEDQTQNHRAASRHGKRRRKAELHLSEKMKGPEWTPKSWMSHRCSCFFHVYLWSVCPQNDVVVFFQVCLFDHPDPLTYLKQDVKITSPVMDANDLQCVYPLAMTNSFLLKMAQSTYWMFPFKIVDLSHSYVNAYQRVYPIKSHSTTIFL